MTYINPSGLIEERLPGVWNDHFHAPGYGGEIVWNDIQAIKKINGKIKQLNQNIIDMHGLLDSDGNDLTYDQLMSYTVDESDPDNLIKLALQKRMQPYVYPLDPYGYPSQGYNQHDHSNEFMGGGIYGAGNHDHRGVGYAGFSFSVYHAGTHIPLRSLRIDT